jgi:hypothetical protein
MKMMLVVAPKKELAPKELALVPMAAASPASVR